MTHQNEKTAKIIFSISEIEKLIWSLTVIKTMRLPVEPEWKIPYKALLKDLEIIKSNLDKIQQPEMTEEEFYGDQKKCKNCND
tara:strand:+ start:11385 stop:11633 length:249 start_codon:yes stop_codon:yes gene_type:complete